MSNTTPSNQVQEKSMSSRLLTMKFMQRAAASESPSIRPSRTSILPSSPSPASTPDSDTQSAKRRKISSDLLASRPSPLTPGPKSLENTPSKYAHNAAESPWILDASGNLRDVGDAESPPPEDEEVLSTGSPPIGRRRFGQSKKVVQPESRAKPNHSFAEDESSSSSTESLQDYRHKSFTYGRPSQASSDGKLPKSRPRDDQSRMDRISGRRIRSGGISASAGR